MSKIFCDHIPDSEPTSSSQSQGSIVKQTETDHRVMVLFIIRPRLYSKRRQGWRDSRQTLLNSVILQQGFCQDAPASRTPEVGLLQKNIYVLQWVCGLFYINNAFIIETKKIMVGKRVDFSRGEGGRLSQQHKGLFSMGSDPVYFYQCQLGIGA